MGAAGKLFMHHHQSMARLLQRNSGLPPPLKQFRATSSPNLCPAGEGCPLPLSPGPSSCPAMGKWEQNQNQTQKHKAKIGTRCSRFALRAEQAGAGSQSSHSSLSSDRRALHSAPWDRAMGQCRGNLHKSLPALERTGYLEN